MDISYLLNFYDLSRIFIDIYQDFSCKIARSFVTYYYTITLASWKTGTNV